MLLSCPAFTLQSIRLLQSLLHCICKLFSPTHPCLYINRSTLSLQVYTNRYGSLLSAVAMGLNIPSGVTVRPTHGDEIGQPLLLLPPCALHAIRMLRMWRTKH